MITLDFFWAIAIYLSFVIALVVGHWIFYNCSRRDPKDIFSAGEYLQQCPYCLYLFFDYAEENLKICPRCRSYAEIQKKGS